MSKWFLMALVACVFTGSVIVADEAKKEEPKKEEKKDEKKEEPKKEEAK